MKRLEQMTESLISCVQGQISGNLQQVDAKELGEAIDMIKDLEEAIYYCTITKALNEEESWEKKGHHQQQQPTQAQNKLTDSKNRLVFPGGRGSWDVGGTNG